MSTRCRNPDRPGVPGCFGIQEGVGRYSFWSNPSGPTLTEGSTIHLDKIRDTTKFILISPRVDHTFSSIVEKSHVTTSMDYPDGKRGVQGKPSGFSTSTDVKQSDIQE